MQSKKTIKNCREISAALILFSVGVGSSLAADTVQSVQKKKLLPDKQDNAIAKSIKKQPIAAGMKIYRDPETGEFLSEPPKGDPQSDLVLEQGAGNFSDEDLEMVTHPDGSVSVDLQGRFQLQIYATMDKNGNIKVNHKPSGTNTSSTAHKEHSASDDIQSVKP